MSQKKRKRERERIPALSGSTETPPTMSFQLELKFQHYIIPKTSLWLIIPWEPGTDAARRVNGCGCWVPGANSPIWVHRRGDWPTAALGQPSEPLLCLEAGDTGATGSWGDVPTVLSSRPAGPPQSHPGCRFSSQPEKLGLVGAGRTGGGRCYLYFRTDPRTQQALKSQGL